MDKKEFTLEVFNSILDKVVLWNSVAGNKVSDEGLIPVYLQLSREEFYGHNEFLQGWFTGDKVMILDGICDLLFTVGFLSKLAGSKPVNTETHFYTLEKENTEIDYLSSNLLREDYRFLQSNLFYFCKAMSAYFDIEGAFESVYESNMSKYIHKSEVWHGNYLDDEVSQIEDKGRYADVSYRKEGEYFIITAGRDAESGVVFDKPKIIKPSTFHEPKGLEQFIY